MARRTLLLFSGVLTLTAPLLEAQSLFQPRTQDQTWNYLRLSQTWPPGFCTYIKEMKIPKPCNIPRDVKSWVIHGLWPTDGRTRGPTFCNDSWKFDVDKIRVILKKLYINWPAFFDKPVDTWSHEWKKHGTCGTSLPALKDELHYFNQTLILHFSVRLFQSLQESGITPSNDRTYNIEDIRESVRKSFGSNPIIFCVEEKKTGKLYLWRIDVCFTKSFQAMECLPDDQRTFPSRPLTAAHDKRLLFKAESVVVDADRNEDFVPTYDCDRLYYIPLP